MDVNARDDDDQIAQPPRLPMGASKSRLMNPTLHLLARRSPPLPDCDDSDSTLSSPAGQIPPSRFYVRRLPSHGLMEA